MPTLIITDSEGLSVSIGTRRAHQWAHQHGKPLARCRCERAGCARARRHMAEGAAQDGSAPDMTLGIGGPRESEAPGIYARARSLIAAMLDRVA